MIVFKDWFSRLSGNSKIIVRNASGAFLIKGLGLIISLLTTPAFISYFNDNRILGVWYTLLSVLTWVINVDLGLGNGIRNQLVKDFAAGDRQSARITLSSGIASVISLALVLMILGVIFLLTLNLNRVFNIEETIISNYALRTASIFILLGIICRFILTSIGGIFYALQKSAINNLLALFVSVLQLLFVLFFHYDNTETALINLSIAYIIIANLPVIVAGIIVFLGPLKDCIPSLGFIRKARIKAVIGVGVVFFICQLLYMGIVNTNEFLVTYFYGSDMTAEYSFYYKLTSIIGLLVGLALTPIWSLVTKAQAEKDSIWLYKLYSRLKKMGLLVILAQFSLVPFLQFIMDLWLKEHTITVQLSTSIAFACFGSCFVYSTILSTIVCGLARMKIQAICYAIGVALKFVVIILCNKLGIGDWSLVVWSNVLVLMPYIIVQQVDLDRFLKPVSND